MQKQRGDEGDGKWRRERPEHGRREATIAVGMAVSSVT